MMTHLSKIYSIKPIRLALKMSICLFVVKAVGDAYYWLLAGGVITYPRITMQLQGVQHSLNPPLLAPYPIQKQAMHTEQIRKYLDYEQRIYEVVFQDRYRTEKIYKNHPMRENPDEIDHFLQYSDTSRILETIYPRILKKMSTSGATIPQGINQKIRQLSQFHFDRTKFAVTPQL